MDQLVQRQNTIALMMQLEKLRMSIEEKPFSDEYIKKEVMHTYIEAGKAMSEALKKK